jgi:rifampicin phosphotransferase
MWLIARLRSRNSRAYVFAAVTAVAACLADGTPAFAIPSPELIVGSFTSISQLVALLSAMVAGGAAVIGARARSSGNEISVRRIRSLTIAAVVLLALSLGANLYQFWSAHAQLQKRLEATLTRPTPTTDGRILDPTLKEVSYTEQLNSPRGISTEETERLLEAALRGERSDIIFLDIREAAETEMGGLPLSRPIRFPDLPKQNLDFSGKTAILFCHNGNRSYETCAALAAKGIDCRFMVGGLEKWLVERRSLTGLNARTLADLRAVPPYRNQTVLLATPEVYRAVLEEGAIFVDVRYPGEFATHHLPGAINLPIRPTPTEQLRERTSSLPHRPIIAPCYDRRSCFFGEILGLELERAGYDFRGRYTLPWEYFTAPEPRPYIEQWLKEAQKTYWDRLVEIVASALAVTARHIGILAAILLLAVLSRLLILPFSLKAESDQIRARAAAAELEALKLRLKNDPLRLTRAIRAFYRRHGLTPLRNLAALVFLPIMAMALLAVQQVTAKGGGHFLWVTNLAERDSSLVLPILFAILICVYADMAFARNGRQRLMILIAGVPILTATGVLFSAGADTYLVASAALLLVQRMAVAGHVGRLWRMGRRLRLPAHIITLDEPARLPDCGNKALRLAQMRAQGMPVPNGIVLPPDFIEALGCGSAAWRRRLLDAIWRQLGCERVVVRSSATAEDGAKRSFAGVFESILNVDRGGLEAAIAKVKASFTSDRASAYATSGGRGSTIVQRMVAAEYAGVLFTQDPTAGGLAMIELVRGTAENLVSGAARPDTYRFGRVSGHLFGEQTPPIDLQPLLALGRQVEALFGAPQDIEWAWQNNQFYLVQSRNITSQTSAVQRSLFRALELAKNSGLDEIAFAKNELSEMIPRPTPLSLSLMESLWASGGSVDLACRSLGLSYLVEDDSPNYLAAILGRLYLNKAQERVRALHMGPFAAHRLARGADRIEYHFRDTFLPKFLGEVRIAEATDFEKLSTSDLFDALERLRDRFVHQTRVEADVINITANFYLTRAREILTRHGLDPSDYMGHIPETDEAREIGEAAHASREERRSLLAASIGHRAVLDYELSEPRYSENPQVLDELPTRHAPITPAPRADAAEQETVLAGMDKAAIAAVATARRFQALKEDARHHSLRELALLRRIILVLDRRLELDGTSFFLSFDELLGLRNQPTDVVREVAHERQKERAQLLDHESPPAILTIRDLEVISIGGHAIHHEAPGLIRGTHVSGSGTVTGRARVVTEADAESGCSIGGFENGDIIVAPMIHPAWLPYFGRAGGFVCEIGGWLSHTAILAREYNTTMIVGTRGLNAIADGSLVRLHPDGAVEPLREEELVRAMAAE